MPEVNDLIEQLKSPSPEACLRAVRELGQLGPEARGATEPLQELLRRLEDADACLAVHDALAAVAPERKKTWDLVVRVRMESIDDRAAARTLSLEEARKWIADLVRSFGDGSPPDGYLTGQARMLVALGVEHPAVLPDLVALFRAEPRLRGQLGGVLEFIARQRPEVADHLLPLLDDSDPAVAEAAACTMADFCHLGTRGGEVVQALLGMFESEHDSSDRAAEALASMVSGDWGHAVVDSLVRSIRQGPEWETGWHRYDLLRQMARSSTDGPRIAALLDLLQDGDPLVREGAARVCRGVEAEKVVLALCQALKDEQPGVRYAAVCALQCCPPKRLGGAVVPHLSTALGDSDSRVVGEAAYCLGRLPEAAAQALPALAARLGQAQAAVSGLAAQYRAAHAQDRALREGLTRARELAGQLKRAIKKIAAAGGEKCAGPGGQVG
jgi:HEAT repeat protein